MPTPKAIELDCPVCHAKIEVDAGFAGGVCRCHACGTLMTVPATADERIEVLYQRSAAGEDAGADAGAKAGPDDETVSLDDDAVVLRTESGRELQVRQGHIGHGRKRRVLRGTIVVAFVGVAVGLIAVTVFAVGLLVSSEVGDGGGKRERAPVVDRRSNPYTAKSATLFGIRLSSPVVVVVDATASSEGWIDLAAAALRQSVPRLESTTKMAVLFCHEDRIESYPKLPETGDESGATENANSAQTAPAGSEAEPAPATSTAPATAPKKGGKAATAPAKPWRPVGAWNETRWHGVLDDVRAMGLGDPAMGVRKAARWDPAQIVLIGGASIDEMNVERLRGALSDNGDPTIPLDLIAIGARIPPSLRTLVAESGGVTRQISTRRLIRWYREASRKGALGDE